MIRYIDSAEGLEPANLQGFFVGWPDKPSSEIHLDLLMSSGFVVLAVEALDEDPQKIVGFITAVTDNVLAAYIPFLEVLPDYQNQGIASELVSRLLKKLEHLYMIDIVCDEELVSFYERFGFQKHTAMINRRYSVQSGVANGKN